MSHEWYYSQLRSRFRRHGGAKILRELYKKRREGKTCAELYKAGWALSNLVRVGFELKF